jgi:hypothetical protein
MQPSDIIVNHDGRDWLVKDGKLVPFREVDCTPPDWAMATPEGYNRYMASFAPSMRESIYRYLAENDPYSKIIQ